ncbi:cytochrome-c oxidase, cbb3-type subunit I, partial [Sinorhizobium meliloti]
MGQLTRRERDLAAAILLVLAIVGIAMAAAGRFDPLGVHGAVVLLYSLALLYLIMSSSFGPPPDPSRISRYYDDPIKVGVWFTLFWAIFGMFIGVWAAA